MSNFVKKTVNIPSLNIDVDVLAGVATLVQKPGKPLESADGRYALGVIKYTLPSGKENEKTAMFWAKTLDHMESSGAEWTVGANYLCQLSMAEDERGKRVFATLSHIVAAKENAAANSEEFDLFSAEVAEQSAAAVEQPTV